MKKNIHSNNFCCSEVEKSKKSNSNWSLSKLTNESWKQEVLRSRRNSEARSQVNESASGQHFSARFFLTRHDDITVSCILDEENRGDNEIMEEWFNLVREKTRLARFEKELLVRAQELELEARKWHLEEQLDKLSSMNGKMRTFGI
jgi:hypothetical protein